MLLLLLLLLLVFPEVKRDLLTAMWRAFCSLLFLTCRVARAQHRRPFIWEKREAPPASAAAHFDCCWTAAYHVAFHLARSFLHAFTHVPAIAVQRCLNAARVVELTWHAERNTTNKHYDWSLKNKQTNLIDDKTSSKLGVIDILVLIYWEYYTTMYMVKQRKILGFILCIQSSSSIITGNSLDYINRHRMISFSRNGQLKLPSFPISIK